MMLSYDSRSTMTASTPATSDHRPLPLSPTTSNTSNHAAQNKAEYHHIWLITGPAGCGKSTVAQFIAKAMNLPYIEGDEVLSLYCCFGYVLTDLVVPSQSQHRKNGPRHPSERR